MRIPFVKHNDVHSTTATRCNKQAVKRRFKRVDFARAYQLSLPIHQRRAHIVEAIRDNQVIIVAGETGSGKTTQLPLMCLEAGRGAHGRIGATQPRRLAAISLARYVARQTATPPGELIGHAVRFNDRVDPEAPVKFMTDGILLNEISSDRHLRQYDTIILDEVHERSINIDFILGYFRTLLCRRPDMRLIISSATLDIRLFAKMFHHAPVITVSGRLYPVDIRYRPPIELWRGRGMDGMIESAAAAVRDLLDEDADGDVLVFMPTVQDIHDCIARLEPLARRLRRALLPLHSRLPYARQRLVFEPGPKIVIATNIAETSLTVPNIRYVADSGLARTVRYEPGAALSRMPVERISRAAADQRAGRCGRVRDGVCVRLFSEQDYRARPAHTTPEIRRANLAGAMLRMASLRLGRPERFPFPQRPPRAAIDAGYRQLRMLGALDTKGALTRLGRRMARFPLDPPLARMLLYAHQHGALAPVSIIAAALSLDSLFVHHKDARPAQRPAAARSRAGPSDFMRFLGLWRALHRTGAAPVRGKALREFCERYGLSPVRVREWIDIHAQILRTCRRAGIDSGSRDADHATIHKSLLTGLIDHIACRQDNGLYAKAGARDIAPLPSSVLARTDHHWVVFHELVETKRTYGRIAAAVHARWLEELFPEHISREYEDARYDESLGTVVAHEQAFFRGLPLKRGRTVDVVDQDRDAAHQIFIAEALVRERIGHSFRFIEHNRAVRATIEAAQHKLRTSRLYAGDRALHAFYDARLDACARVAELVRDIRARGDDSFLCAPVEALCAAPIPDTIAAYPDTVSIGDQRFAVSYALAPGEPHDGATITVSAAAWDQTPSYYWEWLLPVFRRQRIERVFKLLAHHLGVAADGIERHIEAADRSLSTASGPFLKALSAEIGNRFAADIDVDTLGQLLAVDHLWPRIAIRDSDGMLRAAIRMPCPDASALRRRPATPGPLWRGLLPALHGATGFETLSDSPRQCILRAHDTGLAATLAITGSHGEPVLRTYFSRAAAYDAHARTIASALEARLAETLAWELRAFAMPAELTRRYAPFCSPAELDQTARALFHDSAVRHDALAIRRPDQLEEAVAQARATIPGLARRTIARLHACITAIERCIALLDRKASRHSGALFNAISDNLYDTLNRYVCELFDQHTPVDIRDAMPRYLRALAGRIEMGYAAPGAYREQMRMLDFWHDRLDACASRPIRRTPPVEAAITRFRLIFEEFCIGRFGAIAGVKPSMTVDESILAGRYERLERLLDDPDWACELPDPLTEHPSALTD